MKTFYKLIIICTYNSSRKTALLPSNDVDHHVYANDADDVCAQFPQLPLTSYVPRLI